MPAIYINGVKTSAMGTDISILSGTDEPTSAQGYNGQEYLKYAEVESDLEYITSTGDANLHIGITGTKNRKFELKCNIHGGGSYATPIGARVGVQYNAMLLFFKHNGSNNAKYDVNTGEIAFGDTTSYFDKIITITLSNDEVRVEDENGNYISQTPPNVNNFETPEMCLMNLGTSGGGSYGSDCNCYMDIYECKIYEDNVLIKYLLPKTNSNNEIGLVDMLSGTFYKASGTVSGTSRVTPISENLISNAFLKVNGNWQDLIGSNIDDVNLGSIAGGGSAVTKKKNLIISNDTNASTLLENVVDENLEVTDVFAGTYNSEANAYQTDLIKYFYDTVGTYGHQYYWHVIAKTNVTCDGTDYVVGDIIDYWHYNVKKTLLVEEA